MRLLAVLLFGGAIVLGAAGPARAQSAVTAPSLQLSFDASGTVNLTARNVTVRDILSEWQRQCGCYVVNAEKMPGGPLAIPIQFEHASQAAVLESLLRGAAGYALTPKRAGDTSVSNFETIYIVATSHAVAGAYVPSVPIAPAIPMPTQGAPDDELPPVMPQPPQGTSAQPAAPPAPGTSPTSAPVPRQPGTPGSFVPITPVGTPQSTAPAPGTVTPAPPPMPLPQGTPIPGRQ
jgi:hypothetical protein